MGAIFNRVMELSPKLNFILSTAREVYTRHLQEEIERTVYKAFLMLRPLSHRFKIVCKLDDDRYLCVGDFLRIKTEYRKLGSVLDEERFFNVIRNYGRQVAEHVRRPIKEDFVELVYLVEQIKPYSELCVEREVYKVVHGFSMGRVVQVKKEEVCKLVLSTSYPFYVNIINSPDQIYCNWIHIDRVDDLPIIEDLIDDLIELFSRAKDIVSKVKEHNDEVLKRINEVISPWMVVGELKKG